MKKFRIQLVIAAVVFVCGVSLCGMIYIAGNKPVVYVSPGIVTAPCPVANPVPAVTPLSGRSTGLHHHYAVPSVASTPHSSAWSGPSSYRMFETSSATSHMVGSGGGGGFGIATTSHGSSSRGVSYSSSGGSVTMPATSFVAVASSRQVAEPEAQDAPQLAHVSSRRAPGPPNPSGPLDPTHQLGEQPIGDAVWPLLLIAIGYILIRKRRLA